MASAVWVEAQPLKLALVDDGWLSPNAYANHFAPLGDFPAVYLFLGYQKDDYQRAFVAYVGMATKVRRRLSGHEILREIRGAKLEYTHWFKRSPIATLRETERVYIRRFDPPWNVLGRSRGLAH